MATKIITSSAGLLKGKYYYTDIGPGDQKYLFRYAGTGGESKYIEVTNDTFNHGGYFETFASTERARLATKEERDWLDACINAGTFIPRDKVLPVKKAAASRVKPKLGDRVIITKSPKNWSPQMDKYDGCTATLSIDSTLEYAKFTDIVSKDGEKFSSRQLTSLNNWIWCYSDNHFTKCTDTRTDVDVLPSLSDTTQTTNRITDWSQVVRGRVYHSTYNNKSYIFLAKSVGSGTPTNPYITLDGKYATSGHFYSIGGHEVMREATYEESLWFDACHNAKKFIPKDECVKIVYNPHDFTPQYVSTYNVSMRVPKSRAHAETAGGESIEYASSMRVKLGEKLPVNDPTNIVLTKAVKKPINRQRYFLSNGALEVSYHSAPEIIIPFRVKEKKIAKKFKLENFSITI